MCEGNVDWENPFDKSQTTFTNKANDKYVGKNLIDIYYSSTSKDIQDKVDHVCVQAMLIGTILLTNPRKLSQLTLTVWILSG